LLTVIACTPRSCANLGCESPSDPRNALMFIRPRPRAIDATRLA
jgi:hypothetical protein